MTRLPEAPWLERALIGCCINHPRSYALAAPLVGAGDFADERYAEAFECCGFLAGVELEGDRIRELNVRVAAVATATALTIPEVWALVDNAPFVWSGIEDLAWKVLQVGLARAQAAELLGELEVVYFESARRAHEIYDEIERLCLEAA